MTAHSRTQSGPVRDIHHARGENVGLIATALTFPLSPKWQRVHEARSPPAYNLRSLASCILKVNLRRRQRGGLAR